MTPSSLHNDTVKTWMKAIAAAVEKISCFVIFLFLKLPLNCKINAYPMQHQISMNLKIRRGIITTFFSMNLGKSHC